MKRFLKYCLTLLLISLLAVCYFERQWLKDEYIVRTVTQQSTAMTLANDLDLTGQASFVYRASQPEVQTANAFNSSCGSVKKEQSIVLGCYANQRIYVYQVDAAELAGVEQVTAAHELLHAEYARMSSGEKKQIDALLQAQFQTMTDPRLKATIAQYQKTEPGDVVNEMHSIFGTEVANLSPALEAHYKNYFKDRQKIVRYSSQYEQTFTNLETQISQYDTQLSDLKNQKDSLEASLKTQETQIEADKVKLNDLKQRNDIAGYNALVVTYNNEVRSYNSVLTQVQNLVNEYNSLVVQRNNLATTQNNLAHKLDSSYQTIQ